uniref:Integrase catalytic domain-containing protein n=1 Tax=Ditylenchus dipsaci TaxID=166011 RepID=A0A915EUI6_9BILA
MQCLFFRREISNQSDSKPLRREEEPWKRIHIDFAALKGRMFLIIVDSFTRWPEIYEMPTIFLKLQSNVSEGV